MKIVSYNVENLFVRAVALDTSAQGKKLVAAWQKVNDLFGKKVYTPAIKAQILAQLAALGLDKVAANDQAILRENKGKLLVRHKPPKKVEVIASGRSSWIGWVELNVAMIPELAIENTARIIEQNHPDVLTVVEAESRPALHRFSSSILPRVGGTPFDHVMLIDGNDDRGIDVGIMTRTGYPIVRMLSHVDDADADGEIFSRDCAEYDVKTPSGVVTFLVNHFKSRIFSPGGGSDKKRARQAKRVAEIYAGLIQSGQKYVVVCGDLNDDPSAPAVQSLVAQTTLKDVSTLPGFQDGGLPGTYGTCGAKDKIDYILLSPELQKRFKTGGIDRRGVWGGKNGTLFPHIAEMKSAVDAASDHAAIWAELNV